MGYQTSGSLAGRIWGLAERQHGVVTRGQLCQLGLHPQAIKHRVVTGRLHPVWRGVYAVGRPELSRFGHWMAAVLSCGSDAVLSHTSAAALWEILPAGHGRIEVSAPTERRRPGILVHHRTSLAPSDLTHRHGIPVTKPICTLIDIASHVDRDSLEAAISETDKRDLVDPETLREALGGMAPRPGVAVLRKTLDRRTFVLTDSQLERRFLPIVRQAGLPTPLTGHWVNGFKVDFYWPDLGLIMETDGLRYHRTPAQQAKDRVRDHAHAAAGSTCLRFTHAQVRYEPEHVIATLRNVTRRLPAA